MATAPKPDLPAQLPLQLPRSKRSHGVRGSCASLFRSEREFSAFTHMGEMEINLDTFEVISRMSASSSLSAKARPEELEVYLLHLQQGERKEWPHGQVRLGEEILNHQEVGGNAYVNEPALIRTGEDLYLMSIINRNLRSFVEIFSSKDLSLVCSIELPEFIPAGFHGKWDVEL